jgi:hypothetical protein
MMGRRSVPQPLALAEDNSSSSAAGTGTGNDSRGPPSSSSTGAATLSSPESESTASGAASDRPSPRSLFAPDNTLHVISQTVSNKSPRSPRSPFSKFNPARRPQTQQGEPRPQPVEVHQQLPLRSADDTHVVRQQRSHFPNQISQHPPAVPFIKQSATSPILPQAHGSHTDEKHTRSGTRFFNFGKGSRSNNQLHHSHTASNTEAMSRGADVPMMTERVPSKASKHSGTSHEKPSPLNVSQLPSRRC